MNLLEELRSGVIVALCLFVLMMIVAIIEVTIDNIANWLRTRKARKAFIKMANINLKKLNECKTMDEVNELVEAIQNDNDSEKYIPNNGIKLPEENNDEKEG